MDAAAGLGNKRGVGGGCPQKATMKGIRHTISVMTAPRPRFGLGRLSRQLRRTHLIIASTVFAVGCQPVAVSPQLVNDLRTQFAARATDSNTRGSSTVTGVEGWFFFAPELRHVSVGRFWGDRAQTVTRALRPDAADPLPAILDFHRQLAAVNIELLLVPVPPKSIIFPDKVGLGEPTVPIPVPRLDPDHAAFYKLLREQSIEVLDLTERFLDDRFHPEDPLYCRQDTHWSGAGCVVAAQRIAEAIRGRPWYAGLEKTNYRSRWLSTTITGDLVRDLETPVAREELRLRIVVPDADSGAGIATVADDSPIVVLGDSHALVFHAGGDMHAVDSGLADQLALELGLPVDLVAVRGSGATAARVNLFRRAQANPRYWDNKRLVIWCFAAREFTEADGWRTVPIGP